MPPPHLDLLDAALGGQLAQLVVTDASDPCRVDQGDEKGTFVVDLQGLDDVLLREAGTSMSVPTVSKFTCTLYGRASSCSLIFSAAASWSVAVT